MSLGSSVYKLTYEKSPIFLNDGIASFIPGGVLPLIAITQAGDIVGQLATGSISTRLDDFWATFFPMPGAKLHNNQIGNYPFANQKTAANAIIFQPLNISMRMNCSPRLQGSMVTRTMISTALKAALDKHNSLGGTYTVITPSYAYFGCILTGFTDITSGESKHQQTDWQLDFIQPLTSTDEAQQVENSVMSKFTSGIK
jgi:hypothetical protein